MEAIYIPQLLKAPEKTEEIWIEEFIPGLKTLTPVRGRMVVTHHGNYLEVSVQAETIVTLTCDRCLQKYNHRLSIDTSELIWLDEKADQFEGHLPLEREISTDDLSETLPPSGYFSPDTWLYEQLSLAMPMRQLCGKDCHRPKSPLDSEPLIDSRWACLEALKRQLSQ